MSPTGREKTGYATQKPLGILERIVRVHSNPGDRLLDFFAGSGSFGEAAARHGRSFVLVDNNPEAIRIMRKRLAGYAPEVEWRGDLADEGSVGGARADRATPAGPAARTNRFGRTVRTVRAVGAAPSVRTSGADRAVSPSRVPGA